MVEYRLIGRINSVNGECTAGHKVGEEFDLTLHSADGTMRRAPPICGFFYDTIFPYLTTMQFGGEFPWEKEKERFLVGCPENYKVVMVIKRVRVSL